RRGAEIRHERGEILGGVEGVVVLLVDLLLLVHLIALLVGLVPGPPQPGHLADEVRAVWGDHPHRGVLAPRGLVLYSKVLLHLVDADLRVLRDALSADEDPSAGVLADDARARVHLLLVARRVADANLGLLVPGRLLLVDD